MQKLLAILFLLSFNTSYTLAVDVSLDFYGEYVSLSYDDKMIEAYSGSLLEEQNIKVAYSIFQERPIAIFLESLESSRIKYGLNDWLYTKLLHDSLEKICGSRSSRFKNMLKWVVLANSGYDVRATYTRSNLYINVATQEEVFESPMYEDRGKKFANLSVLLDKGRFVSMVYGVDLIPNPDGKNFSFRLGEHPNFKSDIQEINYEFNYKGEKENLSAQVDKTFINMMKEYPKFDEIDYVTTPFSSSLKSSLIPKLKEKLLELPDKEQIEFLVAFTRSALEYASDRKSFGTKNRPLTAEEALYYPTVDCEDKVAVIYNLVKELTSLKAVVIAMPNHLTFGVDLGKPIGTTYRYRGKRFTICDPTGPENSCEIGVFPDNKQLRMAEVLGELR